jgi:hypothetical protein
VVVAAAVVVVVNIDSSLSLLLLYLVVPCQDVFNSVANCFSFPGRFGPRTSFHGSIGMDEFSGSCRDLETASKNHVLSTSYDNLITKGLGLEKVFEIVVVGTVASSTRMLNVNPELVSFGIPRPALTGTHDGINLTTVPSYSIHNRGNKVEEVLSGTEAEQQRKGERFTLHPGRDGGTNLKIIISRRNARVRGLLKASPCSRVETPAKQQGWAGARGGRLTDAVDLRTKTTEDHNNTSRGAFATDQSGPIVVYITTLCVQRHRRAFHTSPC